MSGKNWAIAIGINGYYEIPRLKFAGNDAIAVRDCFREAGFEEVYTFIEGEGNEWLPGIVRLRRFLSPESLAELPLRADDNLWFVFSGHGIRQHNREYLMAIDSHPQDLAGSALDLAAVAAALAGRCPEGNVVLVIDACRNEAKAATGFGVEAPQEAMTFFSCRPTEFSYEITALKQGAFTHALLEGLRLDGARRSVTVEELAKHLRQRVPALTQQYVNAGQNPHEVIKPAHRYHDVLLSVRMRLSEAEKRQFLERKLLAFRSQFLQDDRLAAKKLWQRVLEMDPRDEDALDALVLLRQGSSQTPTVFPQPVSELPAPAPVVSPPASRGLPLQGFEAAVVRLGDGGEEISVETVQRQRAVVMLPGEVPLEMVQIPAGKFLMGSPESEDGYHSSQGPQHEVSVPEFLMGRYPVTQEQWKAISTLPQVKLELDPDPSGFKGDRHPVERVSWFETLEFCARLSAYAKLGSQTLEFRLPSEAEWEYACRAGTTTPFHFGPTLTDKVANYDARETYGNGPKGKYRHQTTEVGYFKCNQKEIANNFGLSDMHGNVWEWCSDWWFDNYDGAPTDGSARRDKDNYSLSAWAQILADWKSGQFDTEQAKKQVLLRGGSWVYDPRGCRSAYRFNRYARAIRYDYCGFRVVCLPSRTLSP